ncbi:unnamed protein product [Didymodactylos carnosus]|uniref:Uncharacterized protein n=1 Tax=Didymodactylos carnosus TaxID=1234261 RepID=A0A8S2QD26_9BILA|nr:unnamed protein product [Didymodactylos carnosus]CAF4093672.1 unnamed protein product [Didymodactylos carnosus]
MRKITDENSSISSIILSKRLRDRQNKEDRIPRKKTRYELRSFISGKKRTSRRRAYVNESSDNESLSTSDDTETTLSRKESETDFDGTDVSQNVPETLTTKKFDPDIFDDEREDADAKPSLSSVVNDGVIDSSIIRLLSGNDLTLYKYFLLEKVKQSPLRKYCSQLKSLMDDLDNEFHWHMKRNVYNSSCYLCKTTVANQTKYKRNNQSYDNNANISACPQPWSYVNPTSYEVLWRIIYWTSQFLTWCLLPFMQSICQTGEFSVKGKIKYALISNLIYYGSLLLIFGILVIYVAVNYHLDAPNLKVIVVTASTTWGLFLLVLMLGYGLVQVPFTVWNHSRTLYMLSHVQFKLSQLYNEKVDIEEKQ